MRKSMKGKKGKERKGKSRFNTVTVPTPFPLLGVCPRQIKRPKRHSRRITSFLLKHFEHSVPLRTNLQEEE
jgi:hypothetical protein